MPRNRSDSVLFDVDLEPVPWFARTTRRLWCVGMGIAGVGLVLELVGVPDAYGRSGAVLSAFAVYCTSVARYAGAIAERNKTIHMVGGLAARTNRVDADVRSLIAIVVHGAAGDEDSAKVESEERDRLLREDRTWRELGDDANERAARWSTTTRALLELEGALLIGGALLWGFGDLDLPATWRAALLG